MLSEKEKQFIQEHLLDDVKLLALQSKSFAGLEINYPFVLAQIAGRQQIKNKIPSWYSLVDLVYPPRISLEQCSSEITAQYKASLLSGDSFVDLTGGFGVDTAFISPRFTQVHYVERQEVLIPIVRHNFSALQSNNIAIHPVDSVEYLQQMQAVDCIYIDPARRSDSGRKVVLIKDCEPNLVDIQDLLLEKANQVLIKLSPMLDIKSTLSTLENVREVHIVSVENECKELLFLLAKETQEEPRITCLNFNRNGNHPTFTFSFSEEKGIQVQYAENVKEYLYEPNVSILKAGFYKGIAHRYCLEKLHSDSHLYTSSELIPDFPGRAFQVEAVSSLNKKELKETLSHVEKANLSIRNFPLSVDELRKRLKLKEGGDVYLFATTLAKGKHVLIKCRKNIK